MKNLALIGIILITLLGIMQPASALMWNWSYSAPGIDASGTLTTNDTLNASGYYLITAITGMRNGETITGLQPTGTSIPGNEPFIIDNLISPDFPQLTGHGFGYETSEGNFVNPFFASFLNPPSYFEVFSAPPLTPDFKNLGPEDSELSMNFSATPITVPETSSNIN
jgi:hypothetical protein